MHTSVALLRIKIVFGNKREKSPKRQKWMGNFFGANGRETGDNRMGKSSQPKIGQGTVGWQVKLEVKGGASREIFGAFGGRRGGRKVAKEEGMRH